MSATADPIPLTDRKPVAELLRRIADLLPADATWNDVQYHIGVCQSIEAGLDDVRAGRVHSNDEVRAMFGRLA